MEQPFDLEFDFLKLKAQFGSRLQVLFHLAFHLAVTGQFFHLTPDKVKSLLYVQISPEFIGNLTNNRDPNRLSDIISSIPMRNGSTFDLTKIKGIFPVPLR